MAKQKFKNILLPTLTWPPVGNQVHVGLQVNDKSLLELIVKKNKT